MSGDFSRGQQRKETSLNRVPKPGHPAPSPYKKTLVLSVLYFPFRQTTP
jgi:hypothetical protein